MDTVKRKISVRKILLTIATLLLCTGCIMAVTTASRLQEKRPIEKLDVQIINDQRIHFLTEEQLYEMLIASRHVDLNHTPLAGVNLRNMEKILNANPWVEKAEVYVDNKGVMHVRVTQREPLLRVFEQNGNSYYLDSSLKITPLSDRFTPYTMVITNVPELKSDSVSLSLKGKMAVVAGVLSRDSFWNAQTAEIYMTGDAGFELIPVLGNHRVILADTDLLQQKLSNVFLFYKQVLNRVGWDKYQVIDVSYKGQVVASPALAWNMPKDNAVGDMNWVKTIMGDEPVEERSMDVLPKPADAPDTKPATTPSAAPPTPVVPGPKPAEVKHIEAKKEIIKKEEPKKPEQKKPEAKKADNKKPEEKKKPEHKKEEEVKPVLHAKAPAADAKAAKPKTETKKADKDEKGKAEHPKTEKKTEKKEDEKQPRYLYEGKK